MAFNLWFAEAFGLWTTSKRPQRVIEESPGLLSVGLNLLYRKMYLQQKILGVPGKKSVGKSLP